MKTFRNYLLVFTLLVAALAFVGCGNNSEEETTVMETTMQNTTKDTTTHRGNSGIIEDTTDDEGVIGDIGNDIESGVDDMMDDVDGNNETKNR